jgi:putative endonuclease
LPNAPRADRGLAAEDAAADFLEARGFVILHRNLRVGRLELDLLAQEGAVIVVVEVRTRGPSSFQRALDSIDAKKRARVRAAGEQLWSKRFAKDESVDRMRFDAASVEFTPGGPRVEHIRGAF